MVMCPLCVAFYTASAFAPALGHSPLPGFRLLRHSPSSLLLDTLHVSVIGLACVSESVTAARL